MQPLLPDAAVMYVGLAPDRATITFHFSAGMPPLTGWREGGAVRWRWGEATAAAPGPAPVAKNMFGPCERPLADLTLDPLGVSFHWTNRAPQRYAWAAGAGFLPTEDRYAL